MKITPLERGYILSFLNDEAKKHKEMLEDAKRARDKSNMIRR